MEKKVLFPPHTKTGTKIRTSECPINFAAEFMNNVLSPVLCLGLDNSTKVPSSWQRYCDWLHRVPACKIFGILHYLATGAYPTIFIILA